MRSGGGREVALSARVTSAARRHPRFALVAVALAGMAVLPSVGFSFGRVAAQDIGVPVVVKPYDGNHGRGVSVNLVTKADVEAAYHLASRKGDSKSVIVERFIVG